jgi:hypothetical protein
MIVEVKNLKSNRSVDSKIRIVRCYYKELNETMLENEGDCDGSRHRKNG